MGERVKAQVDSGKYANASDYVRYLMRRDQEKLGLLRQALVEGEKSGTSSRQVKEIMEEAKSRLRDG